MFLVLETTERFPLKGIARVLRVITAENAGRIRFRGTDWPARFNRPAARMSVLPDTKVQVVGRQGLTLLVEPLKQEIVCLL